MRKNLYRLQIGFGAVVCLLSIKTVGEQPIKRDCASLCSLCEGKEVAKQFTYHLFSFTTGIEANMLLIILLGLIAKLALVSADCDLGTSTLYDFDFSRVGISVLTSLL